MILLRNILFLVLANFCLADKNSEKLLNLAGFTSPSEKKLELHGFGTGFAISPDGYLITASHVTKGADLVRVVFKNGKTLDARVIKEEHGLDLAVLKVDLKTPNYLGVTSRTLGLGDDVYTIGYPSPLILGTSQKFTKGSISSITGLGNSSFQYQVSVPIQPGNSGGALVSEESGEVTGIIVSTLKGKDVVGFNPQNVNYALKSSFIKPILEALEIDLTSPAVVSKIKSDRRKKVMDSTCMVVTCTFSTSPVEGKPFTISDLSMEMLWVKPGTFEMGSLLSEKVEIRHSVTLADGFWLGKHEVTQTQWQKVMRSNPSLLKGGDRPVETVSWTDVTSFCDKLTTLERTAGRLPAGMAYQLPTEAQWEYSCRAGTKTAFSFGEASGELHRYANYADLNTDFDWSDNAHDDGFENTSPVGSYKANAWGFLDMHGNVWEWCADWYGDYPRGTVRDPVGPTDGSYRVLRGSSWDFSAFNARSANRSGLVPTFRSNNLGFRLSLRPASK
jgi:formylglycine-generating enzyme required for sulfatase activity